MPKQNGLYLLKEGHTVINCTVDFTDGNPDFTLPEVKIDEYVAPIVPVITDEEGYRPAWAPYSPIQGSYLIKPTGDKAIFTFTVKPLNNRFGSFDICHKRTAFTI